MGDEDKRKQNLAYLRSTPGGSAPKGTPAKSSVSGLATTGVVGAQSPMPKKLGPKDKSVDFDPSEGDVIEVPVHHGDSGDTGQSMIKEQLNLLQHYIGDYWASYRDGITHFRDTMSFSSEEEAEPHVLEAAFIEGNKAALDVALGHMGPAGEVLKVAIAAIKGGMDEAERAAKAGGERKVLKYVNGLLDGIKAQSEAMRAAVENSKHAVIEAYDRVAKEDVQKGKATPDGRLVGQAAKVVQDVQASVAAFQKAIPTAAFFQRRFTLAFADTTGKTDLVSHGGVEAGKLYFKLHVNTDFTVDEGNTSDAWILVTLNEHADRVAQGLSDSLGGGKPWQIPFTKKVKVQWEEDSFPTNQWHEGWIFFDDSPDHYRIGGLIDGKMAARIWKDPKIRARVLNTMKMTGTKSEPF